MSFRLVAAIALSATLCAIPVHWAHALPGGRGPQVTLDNTISASVLPKLTLTAGSPLAFGEIMYDSALGAGTVEVSPLGAVTVSGGALATVSTSAGTFTVTGGIARPYLIAIDATATLTCSGGPCGAATMLVDNFIVNTSSLIGGTCTSAVPCSATLDASGNDAIAIGGRLNISPGQAEGDYTGTFNITVQYD